MIIGAGAHPQRGDCRTLSLCTQCWRVFGSSRKSRVPHRKESIAISVNALAAGLFSGTAVFPQREDSRTPSLCARCWRVFRSSTKSRDSSETYVLHSFYIRSPLAGLREQQHLQKTGETIALLLHGLSPGVSSGAARIAVSPASVDVRGTRPSVD